MVIQRYLIYGGVCQNNSLFLYNNNEYLLPFGTENKIGSNHQNASPTTIYRGRRNTVYYFMTYCLVPRIGMFRQMEDDIDVSVVYHVNTDKRQNRTIHVVH